jgi:hypothetical protein
MKFNNASDRNVGDAYRRAYWINRLVVLVNRVESEGGWDPEKGFVCGANDSETDGLQGDLNEIAENLEAEGVNFDDVLSGIEAGTITYDAQADSPPSIDLEEESGPTPVVDLDKGTVTVSEAEWDANVDWPNYEW